MESGDDTQMEVGRWEGGEMEMEMERETRYMLCHKDKGGEESRPKPERAGRTRSRAA